MISRPMQSVQEELSKWKGKQTPFIFIFSFSYFQWIVWTVMCVFIIIIFFTSFNFTSGGDMTAWILGRQSQPPLFTAPWARFIILSPLFGIDHRVFGETRFCGSCQPRRTHRSVKYLISVHRNMLYFFVWQIGSFLFFLYLNAISVPSFSHRMLERS